MNIFESRPRADASPSSHGESRAAFLARVAGPFWDQVRRLIEEWFGRLPPEAQSDVGARLRSSDDRQFDAAVLELYLHECLLQSGFEVTCHPEVPGSSRRPDFLATKGEEGFYLEARSVSTSDANMATGNRRSAVYDVLDRRLESPNFFLWIDAERESTTPLRTGPLRHALGVWLATLDPDEGLGQGHTLRADDLPEFTWDEDGWVIKFRAVAKSEAVRGADSGLRPLGVFGGGKAMWIDDATPMQTALSDKGKAYGDLTFPLVVALGISSFSQDDWDVKNALYGSDQVEVWTTEDGELHSRSVRAPNGYWFGGTEWRHRNVSAVLVVKNLYPALVATQEHSFWEHPDPLRPVTAPGVWQRVVNDAGQLERIEPTVTQRALFGLADPWPAGERFPGK